MTFPSDWGLMPRRTCTRPHGGVRRIGRRNGVMMFLLALVLTSTICTRAAISKGGGSKSSGSSSSSSSAARSSTQYVYGRSHGTTVGRSVRLASVLLLTSYVFFNDYNYPYMRFYYADSYYDDCALRNITAANLGLSDASINVATVNTLPQVIPDSATTADLLTFNQTLYNVSNGLIVDPAYCNYTVPGAAGPALRWSAGWALVLAVVAALFLAGGSSERGGY